MTDNYFPDPAAADFETQRAQLARRRKIAQDLMNQQAPQATLSPKGWNVTGKALPAVLSNALGQYDMNELDKQEKLLSSNEAQVARQFLDAKGVGDLAPGLAIPSLRKTIEAQIGQQLDYPQQEKVASAAATVAARQHASDAAARADVARENAAARADEKKAQREWQEGQNAESRNLRATIAASARQPSADAELNRQLKEERLKQLQNPKMSPSQQKAADDADIFLSTVDNAVELLKANPDSLGKKTLIPDVALQRIDPDGVATRAAIGGLSAEKIHTLSGAAVSPAEFARLRPYLPASGDTTETVAKKLQGLRAEAARIKARHNQVAAPTPPAVNVNWSDLK